MEGYLMGQLRHRRQKRLGNSSRPRICIQFVAFKKGYTQNERRFVISKVWMLVRQSVSMWQTSEFNHHLLVWFDKVWWVLCSVSGADLAWFGQERGTFIMKWLPLWWERGTESHTTSFVARAAPTSGRHFMAAQRKAADASANQMRSGDRGWGGGGDKRWEKAWICL